MKMLWLRECTDNTDVGPKARRLAQALRLGLRIPDGLVVLPDEDVDSQGLAAALTALQGTIFAVRSSATREDLPGRSAAGLFVSRTQVPAAAVAEAVQAVRQSGQSQAVQLYCSCAVPVAVLIQPMVPAERLGVLYIDLDRDRDGSALCEERPASAPEWASVTTRALPAGSDSPLAVGAHRLAELLREESGARAAYVEYALERDGAVTFLQVRPAPPSPQRQWPVTPGEEDSGLVYVHDQEHNPDPLSRAQSGLVEGVADLVPGLHQRVFRGYLYYAETTSEGGTPPAALGVQPVKLIELAERYAHDIVPTCEALLQPLERYLFAADGALDARYLADPSLCELPLCDAWTAYRGVYRVYVAQLGPALRRARHLLDELLRNNLGEPLLRHGALLAAAAEAPTKRLQELWELGHAGAPEPLLRAYLARHGAYASSWDIAAPCDDERPEWLREAALRLAEGPEPRQQRATAEASYHAALAQLLDRLPRMARGALKALLPQARTAQRIAEEDDALFFRSQRLCRWALLRRGALLVQAGRLDTVADIFDLPWTLQAAHANEFRVGEFAKGLDLRSLAAEGAGERAAARALVPPARLVGGQPLWTPPAAEMLCGCGVPGAAGGPVRGRALVIRSLFPCEPPPDVGPETILVLPVLLPSWAAEAWRAAALITDSGGALSHGAILARERGVPAVIGTRAATRTIRDGQELWVDADRGRVYLLP